MRVAGPFTVESISPTACSPWTRTTNSWKAWRSPRGEYGETVDFPSVILDNLRTAGVQQAHKEDRISFTSVTPWPGPHGLRGRNLHRV